MTYDLRLVAYEPNGSRLGVLHEPLEFNCGLPLNDVSSLIVKYSRAAQGAELLDDYVELAVERYADGAWEEIPNGRFVKLAWASNHLDETRVLDLTLPGYGWLLATASVRDHPSPTSENTDDQGKRKFSADNAGIILRTLIQEAQDRDTLPGLVTDFDTSVDSDGQAWDKVLTIAYEPGLGLDMVLNNLADQGVIDWQMQGRTLRVFNADTVLAEDKTDQVNPVVLRSGIDITSGPDQGDSSGLLHNALVRGEAGARVELTNPSAPAPWGHFEGTLNQGGVSDTTTMTLLAQAALADGAEERVQMTRELLFLEAVYLPFVDYVPGDYIYAPGNDGVRDKLRVQQITLVRDNDGVVSGNAVLNDRFIEATIRQAKRTKGIVGGSRSDGGSGALPADPSAQDTRIPAAPTGLVVQSDAYVASTGVAQGTILAEWNPVTAATDATALEVSEYELWGRQGTEDHWRLLTKSEDTAVGHAPFEPGTTWQFRVRARGRYATTPGLFSSTVAVLIEDDIVAPPKPSTPVLTSSLGTVKVYWDGKTSAGSPMPVDLSHAEIYTEHGAGPAGGLVLGSGGWVSTPDHAALESNVLDIRIDLDTSANPYWVDNSSTEYERFIVGRWDRTGLQFVWRLSYYYDGLRLITSDGTVSSSRYSGGAGGHFGRRTLRVTATASETKFYLGDSLDTDEWIEIGSDSGVVGGVINSATSLPVTIGGDANGDGFSASLPYTLDATVYGFQLRTAIDGTLVLDADWTDADSVTPPYVDNAGRSWGYNEGAAVTPPETEGGPIGSMPSLGQILADDFLILTDLPKDQTVEIALRAVDRSGNVSTYSDTASIEVQRIEDVEIADGAIKANHLTVGSIKAEHIMVNQIDATKIVADAITAKHTITGATIQTSALDNRGIKITSTAMRAYNSLGETVFQLFSSSGDLTAVGRFRTGFDGIRVEVDSEAYNNRPGIRFVSNEDGTLQLSPVIQGIGDGGDGGYPEHSIVIMSGEDTTNSSGRADLQLNKGGDWSIKQQYGGTHSGVGIYKEDHLIRFRGGMHESWFGDDMWRPYHATGVGPTSADASGFWSTGLWSWSLSSLPVSGTRHAVAQVGGSGGISTSSASPYVVGCQISSTGLSMRIYSLGGASSATSLSAHILAYWST